MANSSMLPPMKNNGGKYAILGLLLLGGLAALWYFVLREPPREVAPTPPPVAKVTKIQPQFEIPAEEPDAGADEPAQKPSVVTRECVGTLSKADIKETIEGVARKQVRACYERELKANNRLQGTMNVLLTINPNGRVSSVQTGGSLNDRKIAACVRTSARSWRFAKPVGGCVQTVVPFALSPKSE